MIQVQEEPLATRTAGSTIAGTHPARRRTALWLTALYGFGLLHWLAFFYVAHPASGRERDLLTMVGKPSRLFQRPSFGFDTDAYSSDGYFITRNKLVALREALRARTLPYHLPGLSAYDMLPTHDSPIGDRLFAVPYGWPWSPQMWLLLVLDLSDFVVVNWLLLYSIGFAGCVLIQRRYGLGPVAFTFLFLLFNFNGWIISNVSTYPIEPGAGYFFSPFLLLVFLPASQEATLPAARQTALGLVLALALSAIWYQGSAHPFIFWLTFLLCWGLVNWRKWRMTLVGFTATVALCANRIIPAALTWRLAHRPELSMPGMSGFWSFDDYVQSLAVARPYTQAWPAFNFYISIFGVLAILWLAGWGPFQRASWIRFRGQAALMIPAGMVALLSFRRVKFFLIPSWVPLLNAEVYTSRYVIVPLLISIAVASVNFQGAVEASWGKAKMRGLAVTTLGLIAITLMNHSRLWRIGFASAIEKWPGYPYPTLPPRLAINWTDTVYIASVRWSLAASCVALLVIVVLLVRLRSNWVAARG